MENKICNTCKDEKPLDQFSKKSSSKDGLSNYCKSCNKIVNKKFKDLNPLYMKEYDDLNKLKRKEYYINNIDDIKLYFDSRKHLKKIYDYDNREIFRNKKRERYNNDPFHKLNINIRNAINGSFRNILEGKFQKKKKSIEILGCNYEEFIIYIESKFESWMNLNNKGNPKDNIYEPNKTWDLDHIIPLSSAKTEEDLYKLNHYTNFQPLCSYYNRFIKRDKNE